MLRQPSSKFFKEPKKKYLHSENKQEIKYVIRYVSLQEIFPAQTRYSYQNALEKKEKAIIKGAANWDNLNKKWIYKYHHGTSILPKKKALPVVLTSFGYVLVDGHHDVMSSILLQAEMIPIKVIKDLSHLSPEQFWNEAEMEGWAYLYSLDGKHKILPPQKFSDLTDDPNRYFAGVTARKYSVNEDGSYSSKGADYPLWIKINRDIPFIEFKIADALYAAGFNFNKIDIDTIEEARKILLKADIQGLRVVPHHIHHLQMVPDLPSLTTLEKENKLRSKMT